MTAITDLAFLILRVFVGLTIASHGAQKLFGWFGGGGLNNTSLFFEKQGFKPSWFWLSLACLGEFGGGLSLATGFLTPLGAAGIVGAMSMAAFKTHWKNGFFNQNGGFEYPLTILVVSLFFGLTGPGTFSLDALLRINLAGRALFIVCALLALVVVGIGILVSMRQKAQPIS